MLRYPALVAAVSLLACCLTFPALAQNTDTHHNAGEVKLAHADAGRDGGAMTDADLRVRSKPLKKDVNLVLVPVTITDPLNQVVPGLEKENFVLMENKQPQQIRYFSTEDAPISVGVIFDVSASMSDKMDKARKAIVEFFRTANSQDEFFIVTFSERPQLLVDFTSSLEEIENRLEYAEPAGPTSLLDAIYLGIQHMHRARYERKALLIISDGGDNHSRYTQDEIVSMVRESDVQIFGMGIFARHQTTPEEAQGPLLLGAISGATGGQTYFIGSPKELPDAATKISIALRNQYLIGYRPADLKRDGKWRKIKVKVKPPEGSPSLHVYAKSGYYASAE